MILKEDFYWGGSASSFQAEGAWNEGGKGLSVYDMNRTKEGLSDWKVGIDFYHRYKEDIALLKEMGCNFYRFSIAWCRVIPDGDGQVNEEGLAFYDRVINELIDQKITPMICLYHFDVPYALIEKYNGFYSRKVVDAYERYARIVMKRYSDRVKYWMTFNEQNLHSQSLRYSCVEHPVEGDQGKILFQTNHHVMMAHCKAVKALREIAPDAKICGMITYGLKYPYDCDPQTALAAMKANDFVNHFQLDLFSKGKYPDYMVSYLNEHGWMPKFEEEDEELLKNTVDFIAFSYYASSAMKACDYREGTFAQNIMEATIKNPYVSATDWGWQIDPVGFRYVLNDAYYRCNLPVFVLENGMANFEELVNGTVEDDLRIQYHKEHIINLMKAVKEDGVECLGYITWGPIDILSSQGQMEKRYGFVYVNRGEKDLRDLKRYKKKSFAFIKETFESNGQNLEKSL